MLPALRCPPMAASIPLPVAAGNVGPKALGLVLPSTVQDEGCVPPAAPAPWPQTKAVGSGVPLRSGSSKHAPHNTDSPAPAALCTKQDLV